MPYIIASAKDIASLTIKRQLMTHFEFKTTDLEFDGYIVYQFKNSDILLVTSNRDLIDTNHLESNFKTDLFIFASRHKSQSGTPALLAHTPGNLTDDTSLGGNPREIAVSSPNALKIALIELMRQKIILSLTDFQVSLEVTHHGPTDLNTPVIFVELGSDESRWGDKIGALAVARTIMRIALEYSPSKNNAIGFGGGHYASKFSEIVYSTDISIGHMAPKYKLDDIDEQIVKQMIERTDSKIDFAIIDWKGCSGPQRRNLINIFDNLGLPYYKGKEILKKAKVF